MELIAGHTYEARKPKASGVFNPLYNDRQIVYINWTERKVQYDSPTVAMGRRLPFTSFEKFEKWAGRDVTEEMPEGQWRPWNVLDHRK